MDDLQVDTFGLPINKEVCFSRKNKLHQGTMKRQLGVLKPLAPMLRQMLRPGEEILIGARACSHMSLLEQMTSGWAIYYLKRCVLVFTNRRIIHFPTRANFLPKHSVAQALFGDIEKLSLSGFLGRTLALRYKSGREEKFHYIQPKEFKNLKTILPSLPKDQPPSEARERHHLCPRCQTPLAKDRFACGNCHLKFKDRAEAVRFALLYPGGGYFYTNHLLLGTLDAIVEGALLFGLIAILVDLFTGSADPEQWIALVFIAISLVIEKAVSIYHVKHYVSEYIPQEQDFVPVMAPR